MRNYRIALGIGAGLMIVLLIVGILQDPAAFLADAARIPQAWASLALWLAVSVLVFWLAAEVLTRLLIGKGLSTKRIADQLNLSGRTVEVHRAHIKRKMQCDDLAQLLREAIRFAESQS